MKKGDERRDELLATAERLFYSKGYERTSVQDILTQMGYSKGGFYHHFDSKFALLQAICERRAQENCARARASVLGETDSACAKLNALFHSAALWQSDNPGFVALLIQTAYREDGALMREKMEQCQREGMRDVLEGVLREGVHTREFFVSDVPACASVVLRLYMQFADEIAFLLAQEESEERMAEAMVSSLCAYRTAIERVLLAPFGSIVLFDAKELQLLGQSVLRSRIRQRADELLGAGAAKADDTRA